MASISTERVVAHLTGVLKESCEGAPGPKTYFTDAGAASSLFGSLKAMNASRASEIIGGTSIAAHAYHILFALNDAGDVIDGVEASPDWKQSWQISKVDDAKWSNIRESIENAYDRLLHVIEDNDFSKDESLGEAIGVVAHVAFHLGSIRQKIVFQNSQK